MVEATQQLAGESRTTTIRFGQIDGAGIVFYPRYFEMLERYFGHKNLFSPPRSIETQFMHPNRLGDEVTLHLECSSDNLEWSVYGRYQEADHFRISGEPAHFEKGLQKPGDGMFTAAKFSLGQWACDSTGSLSVSTYYEILSDAVESWFESVLQVQFRELHFKRRMGIPTVMFATDIARMPNESDDIHMLVSVTEVGTKSMQLTHVLGVGDECLIVTRQTIVFVAFEGDGYIPVRIPSDLRDVICEQASKFGGS